MSFQRLSLCAILMSACAGSAAAQTVKIEFSDGRVSLSAQNAPVRAVLAEWARRGGTQIVNGDNVSGPLLTLELTGMPERQALEILLRSVPGYILSARPSPGVGGASSFDRVMIMATATAPRPATTATLGAQSPRAAVDPDADDTTVNPGVQRGVIDGRAVPVDQNGRVIGQPVVVTQSPNSGVVVRPGGATQPFFPEAPPAAAPPPPAPGQAPRPANPFAPTPVPPQPPQDGRPSPNTPER
jgi:type II secretory pathway component HofQ